MATDVVCKAVVTVFQDTGEIHLVFIRRRLPDRAG
jgi:hypothetical protein